MKTGLNWLKSRLTLSENWLSWPAFDSQSRCWKFTQCYECMQERCRENETGPGIIFGATEFRYDFGSYAGNNYPKDFFRYRICNFYRNYPVLPFLVFWKLQGKPPKRQGFFIPAKPLKSLEKKGKTLKKTRNSSQGEKKGIQKKQGKEGQGINCPKHFFRSV